ncbi:hypothetical protein EDC94DRAFT_592282 [Helicostylum pulchrum]|uniref:Uncharacterized protein n=1 Tax=Helicostylum pulchrum TaxID=562976 RepID=A0ABP9XJS5_9FUNG|nr:hypothetical protein EDC94DRAFT_592282 [Helicostylum pulchrum]
MSNWEFVAPQFWDLSDSVIQDRPNDSWFNETNISAPSFPIKRRLRPKFNHKSFSLKVPSLSLKASTEETVYDRLARESTISFSRKMNPPQKRFLVDEQPNVEPIKESTAERLARLESSHKSSAPRKRLKVKSHRSTERQTLYNEMQKKTPVAQPTHNKQVVSDFFQNLLKENQQNKLATSGTVHSFFENLKLKNKLLYSKKAIEIKQIKQEVIEVSIRDENSLSRKRVLSSTPVQNKRPRVELDP